MTGNNLLDIIRKNREEIFAATVAQVRGRISHYAAAPEDSLRASFDSIEEALADYWERGDEAKARDWAEMRARLSANLGFVASEILRAIGIFDEVIQHCLQRSSIRRSDLLAALTELRAGMELLRRHYLDAHLALREQRLARLHELTVAINTGLALEQNLELIVSAARDLAGARYAALGVPDEKGRLARILCSGLTGDEQAAIGQMPQGQGLLGAVLREGEAVRLRDLTEDPRHCGFPPHHPVMHSFMGVPIVSRGQVLGGLYLTEKQEGAEFSEDDQRLIELLVAHAATAIENAGLYEAMRAGEERYRTLAESAPDFIFVIGRDGTVQYVNAAAASAFGVQPEDLNEKPVGELFPAGSFEHMERSLRGVFESGQPLSAENSIQFPGGELWLSSHLVPLTDTHGEVEAVMGISRDITERKRAEEEQRRASISRALVGEMLRDLASSGGLSEGVMFQAGQELAARVDAKTLPEYLDAFAGMGLGALGLAEGDEDRQRWTFTGERLVLRQAKSEQPTCHYCRGYLCGAVAGVTDAPRVVGVEVACQSMGDDLCRFVVQVVE